jgi:uncharacterized membrane protein
MNRWRNKGLWVSVASLALLICQIYGLLPKLGLTSETFNAIVNGILGILTIAGVISNPTSGNGYVDEKEF